MRYRHLFAAALLSAGWTIVPAGTTTATLSISATVNSACVVTTSPVSFGVYDPTSGTASDAAGAVNVTCTVGTTYSVALDAGANASSAGDVTTRRMIANAGQFLPYQLYLDVSRSTIWGDGLNGSSKSVGNTGNGAQQGLSAFGRITSGKYVPPGSYSDSVIATVEYN